MQRLLAIDCDTRELCYVLASVTGSQITLESAATVSLKSDDESQALSPTEAGKRLQSALSKSKRTGAKVLVGVDRNAIDLHPITVPPATDAELPELVINQLAVDAAENAIIDFIPTPGKPDESRTVTAASLSRQEFDRINSICAATGVAAKRMMMRPYATASLFLNQGVTSSGRSLLVNIIVDEVDLIVVDQTQALFFRTVRLPSALGDEATEQRLLDEIRRTLLIAPQSAEVGQTIESVFIFGTGPEYQRIVEQLGKDGATKVQIFDPLATFQLGSQWQNNRSGRLNPLLGMIVDEAKGGPPTLDFANPRRPPKPPNRVRQIVLAAAAVLTVAGLGYYYVSDQLATADKELKSLAAELAEQDRLLKKYADKKKMAEAVEDWNSNGVIWLDELRELATRFPSGQDLVIQRLAMTPSRGGKASISFQGLTREAKVVSRMESALRDSRHEVQTPRVEERINDKRYAWSFDASISLTAPKSDLESLIEGNESPAERKEPETNPEPAPEKPRRSARSTAASKAKDSDEQPAKSKSSRSKRKDVKTDHQADEVPREESSS